MTSRTALWIAARLALLTVGCAHPTREPARAPAPPTATGYAWPPAVVTHAPEAAPSLPSVFASEPAPVATATAPAQGLSQPADAASAAEALPEPEQLSSATIPGGDRCLAALKALGVKHRSLDAKRGVVTPVVVDGPIGGVRYTAWGGVPLIADCRLIVALAQIAPELKRQGISQMRYSGAYSYRMSRVGRLSLHAHGLAIDIHEVTTPEGKLDVKHDFVAGLDDGCSPERPTLNRLACRLKQTGLFKELLTPDYDADHRDHLHLAIAPERREAPGTTQVAKR